MSWESPRGPITIDPETRDIVQTIYIRRVQKVDGALVNVEFDKVENVKDPRAAGRSNRPTETIIEPCFGAHQLIIRPF